MWQNIQDGGGGGQGGRETGKATRKPSWKYFPGAGMECLVKTHKPSQGIAAGALYNIAKCLNEQNTV